MIHCRSAYEPPRSACIIGPAVVAIVASSRSIIAAASAAENPIQVAFVMVLGCMGSSPNGMNYSG